MSDLSASPERDTAYRDRARIVAFMLQRFTRGMLTNEDVLLQLRVLGYAKALLKLPADLMQDVGLPAIRVPVILEKPERPNMAAGYLPPAFRGDTGKILLPILPHANWNAIYEAWQSSNPKQFEAANRLLEEFQEIVNNWFERRKAFVVHEMTHMFDYLRIKEAPRIMHPEVYGFVAYHNSAVELNAQFQEMLADIEERVPQLPHVAQEAIIGDFDAFWSVARQTRVYRKVWPYLTPKNKRKFYARAAQYWKSIQPAETAEQRQEPLRLPDVKKQAKAAALYHREEVREPLFDRLQREIEARRGRRR